MKYNRYQKRDAVKNYFPLPNEIFCLGLSAGEIAVYAYLMYCEDRKTFQCYPSYKTIGSAVALSKNTVKKHIDGLVAKQLITAESTTIITKKGQKHNGTLLYTIRPIQEAVDYRYQQQLAHFQTEMYRKKRGQNWRSSAVTKGREKSRRKHRWRSRHLCAPHRTATPTEKARVYGICERLEHGKTTVPNVGRKYGYGVKLGAHNTENRDE